MGHSTFFTVLVGPIQFLVVAALALGLFYSVRSVIRAKPKGRFGLIVGMAIGIGWIWASTQTIAMMENNERERARQKVQDEFRHRLEEIKRHCDDSPAPEVTAPVVPDQNVVRFEYRKSWSNSWEIDDKKGVNDLTKTALFPGSPFTHALELVQMRSDDPRCQQRGSANDSQCIEPGYVYKVWPKDGEERLALLADFYPKYVVSVPPPSRYGDDLSGQTIELREGEFVLANATVYETGGMVCPDRGLLIREMISSAFLKEPATPPTEGNDTASGSQEEQLGR
jgi:hypothetical protein